MEQLELVKLKSEINELRYKISESNNGISEDTRKSIILDATENLEKKYNAKLQKYIGVGAIIVAIAGYIGHGLLKQKIESELSRSDLKDEVRFSIKKDLDLEVLKIKKENENLRKISELMRKELADKEKDIQKMLERFKLKEMSFHTQLAENSEKLSMATHYVLRLASDNKNFDKLYDDNFKLTLPKLKMFSLIKHFGVSEYDLIRFFTFNYREFDPTKITESSLRGVIKNVQGRYEILEDGDLGPCTSFVLAALVSENFNLKKDNIVFSDLPWLVNIFQSCSMGDKATLLRHLDYSDLPLHNSLHNYLETSNISKSKLRFALRSTKVNSIGFKALAYLDYEPGKIYK